jgi:hypothetical protein
MAATNAHEFTLGLERSKVRSRDRHRRLTKAVAMRALEGLVLGTRVDTGRARGNWQAGESRPPEGHDPERKDQGGAQTISIEGRKVLAMSGSDIIWLHNGVPYIGVLESWDKMLVGNVEALRTWLASQR